MKGAPRFLPRHIPERLFQPRNHRMRDQARRRMRQQATLENMTAIRRQWDKLPRQAKLGTIPRSAAFSVLTTQDYQKNPRFLRSPLPPALLLAPWF